MRAAFSPLAWLILVVAVIAAFALGDWNGARRATKTAELDESKRKIAAAAALIEETQKTMQNERALVRALDNRAEKYLQEENHAKAKTDRLIADLRSRVVRLSLPVARQACVAAGIDSAAAGQPGTETRAELMPEAAIALVGIANDGDSAVRQLNAVISAYNDAREACYRQLAKHQPE